MQIFSSAYLESSLHAVLVSSPSTRSGMIKIENYFQNHLQVIFWRVLFFLPKVLLWRVLFLFHHLHYDWTGGHDTQHIWRCWKWVFRPQMLNDVMFGHLFSQKILLWGKWCTRIIYFYIQIYSDKGFYMLISTFYILAGLAFTSTIIEIIRQVWKWRHF